MDYARRVLPLGRINVPFPKVFCRLMQHNGLVDEQVLKLEFIRMRAGLLGFRERHSVVINRFYLYRSFLSEII